MRKYYDEYERGYEAGRREALRESQLDGDSEPIVRELEELIDKFAKAVGTTDVKKNNYQNKVVFLGFTLILICLTLELI